ncbi:hypothetical protein ABKA04_007624 [Annulohypoxylon sp. FPYF3050]
MPSAAAAIHINNARTAVFSMRMYALNFRGGFILCDTILAILGASIGAVDSYVVWKGGNPLDEALGWWVPTQGIVLVRLSVGNS